MLTGTRLFYKLSESAWSVKTHKCSKAVTTPECLQEMAGRKSALKILSDTVIQYNSGGTVFIMHPDFQGALFF